MAITNLTGTTWKFNDNVKLPSSNASYSINFKVLSGADANKNFFVLTVWVNAIMYGYPYAGGQGNISAFGYTTEHGYSWAKDDYKTIRITDGTDVTNENLIAWLKANATFVAPPTLITYDGVTAEMQDGQTATLNCAGKKAETDIVIVPEFPVDIAYGAIINVAHKGQTATLKCEGKKMAHDVVISTSLTISGTWLLNQNVDFSMLEGELIQEINGQMVNTYNYPFDKIRIKPSKGTIDVYVTSSGYLTYKPVYSNGWIWNDTAIKFGDEPQAVTIDFYNWLTANATMQ